jgi:serine/threonine protein kinase HipA of HipAB toxin-antitoxin module
MTAYKQLCDYQRESMRHLVKDDAFFQIYTSFDVNDNSFETCFYTDALHAFFQVQATNAEGKYRFFFAISAVQRSEVRSFDTILDLIDIAKTASSERELLSELDRRDIDEIAVSEMRVL